MSFLFFHHRENLEKKEPIGACLLAVAPQQAPQLNITNVTQYNKRDMMSARFILR